MKTFAEKLKAARAAAGLTQAGMAERTLIPARTLENWEAGVRTPPEYVQRFVLNELAGLAHKPINRVQKTTNTKNAYNAPLGYKWQDGKLIRDEEEAAATKRAFEEYRKDGEVSPETTKELHRLWRRHLGI